MRSFIKKMYICLFEPRKMGLYFGERLLNSFIHVFLCALIAILPYTISLITVDEISNSSYNIIEEWIMENNVNTDLSIVDGRLTGEKKHAFYINEAILYINPKDEVLNITLEDAAFHVIEFDSEGIKVYFLNNAVYSKTYLELGVMDLNFERMENADYVEFDKFISLINVAFDNIRLSWILSNVVLILLDIYLTVLISALLLAFVVKIFNPIIGFRFRFKAALDSQHISLFFIFLMLLFNAEFFRYIGIVFSCIYLIKAMMAIIRIEFKKKMFTDKDEEE